MIRINLGYIFKLNERLTPIIRLGGEHKFSHFFIDATLCISFLEELFGGSVYHLRTSKQSAERLYAQLKYLAENIKIDDVVPGWQISQLVRDAQSFEMALNDELSIMPSYLVTPKGGYDVNTLITDPHQLFPPDMITLVPETHYDAEQAAKCLAFEVPTAAGFHLHGLNESVLHRYWDVVTKGAKRPKERNMGVYLRELKKRRKGDAKTKAALQQIKDLHRNPLLHPEENLTLSEAIELYGIIVSVVSKMLNVIRNDRRVGDGKALTLL